MYNSFNNMWNWDYIQQQQALQHHQNQVYQIADCAKKLKDFLESAEKIDPTYEKAAFEACCAVLLDHANKQRQANNMWHIGAEVPLANCQIRSRSAGGRA